MGKAFSAVNQHFSWDTGEAATFLRWRSDPRPGDFLEDPNTLAPDENAFWVSELFLSLSPKGRAVVSLYLVEGESVRGVAETLDLTPGEVEAWLEHGLMRIRDGLQLLGLSRLSEEEIAALLKEFPQPAPLPGFLERLLRLREGFLSGLS